MVGLNYRPETIVEVYYLAQIVKWVALTADYQFIADPGHNADRGPVCPSYPCASMWRQSGGADDLRGGRRAGCLPPLARIDLPFGLHDLELARRP